MINLNRRDIITRIFWYIGYKNIKHVLYGKLYHNLFQGIEKILSFSVWVLNIDVTLCAIKFMSIGLSFFCHPHKTQTSNNISRSIFSL